VIFLLPFPLATAAAVAAASVEGAMSRGRFEGKERWSRGDIQADHQMRARKKKKKKNRKKKRKKHGEICCSAPTSYKWSIRKTKEEKEMEMRTG